MYQYDKLTEHLKKYKNVLIMTHKDPDLDGFSSALVMGTILHQYNISYKIYLNDTDLDVSIKKSLIEMNNKDFFITADEYEKKDFDLLLVVDTNKVELLENSDILNDIKDVIIIDHHIKGNSFINSVYEIVDIGSSSTAEIVVGYIKKENIKLDRFLYTMLLAGIEIDTSTFSVKISPRTFYMGAYLLENGADSVLKQELLKENRDEYVKKQYFIQKSFIYKNSLMISVLDENIYDKKYLATISEDLLLFEGIEASFTIGNIDENLVGISARSIGNIDVESIISKLGGGGHKTNAAAQLETSKEEVKKQLLELLKEIQYESNIH